jgi:hypothetical protein
MEIAHVCVHFVARNFNQKKGWLTIYFFVEIKLIDAQIAENLYEELFLLIIMKTIVLT